LILCTTNFSWIFCVNVCNFFLSNMFQIIIIIFSCLNGVMVSVWFETWSSQTKDWKIGICSFSASAKHAAFRRKSKDWLTRNQDNVSEWGDMSIRSGDGVNYIGK
jgi:hypothetical protein